MNSWQLCPKIRILYANAGCYGRWTICYVNYLNEFVIQWQDDFPSLEKNQSPQWMMHLISHEMCRPGKRFTKSEYILCHVADYGPSFFIENMLIDCIYFHMLQLWLLPLLTTDIPDIHFLTEVYSSSLQNYSYIYQQIIVTVLYWMYWYGWFCCCCFDIEHPDILLSYNVIFFL